MDFAGLARRAAKFAVDNSPTILTSIGVVGTVTTAYLAGKASYRLAGEVMLHNDRISGDDKLVDSPRSMVEFLRESGLWKNFIPPVATGTATVVCIIGANRVGMRRAASIAAAYSILEKAGEEYKTKVVEKLGERKEEALRDEIQQERLNNFDPAQHPHHVLGNRVINGIPAKLCYDKWSDRLFFSNVEAIQSAVNDLNKILLTDGYACAADFYRILDLPAPSYSESIGWTSDRFLEVRIGAAVLDGEPAITMEFRNEPHPDYGRFHR